MATAASASEGPVLEAIAAHKEAGNAKFGAKAFDEAAAEYGIAVRLLPDIDDEDEPPPSDELRKQAAVLLCNRAAAHMGAKRAVAALADAQRAADFDPSNWKAHWRTGVALMMMEPRLERSEQAVAAFERTLKCSSLPDGERDNVNQALQRAQYRLREGRDALDMPDMSSCLVS